MEIARKANGVSVAVIEPGAMGPGSRFSREHPIFVAFEPATARASPAAAIQGCNMRRYCTAFCGCLSLVLLVGCGDAPISSPTDPLLLKASAPDVSPVAGAAAVTVIDLGTLGGEWSFGSGVNDRGEIVGRSQIATGAWHAFLWTPDTGMTDLGTLGGEDSGAAAINDRGYIVGQALTTSGGRHAVV